MGRGAAALRPRLCNCCEAGRGPWRNGGGLGTPQRPRGCPADHAADAGSGTPSPRGGTPSGVVVGRRLPHSRLLPQRLKGLGGTPRAGGPPSRRLPPPPCSCTHQTPLTSADQSPLLSCDLIRRTAPRLFLMARTTGSTCTATASSGNWSGTLPAPWVWRPPPSSPPAPWPSRSHCAAGRAAPGSAPWPCIPGLRRRSVPPVSGGAQRFAGAGEGAAQVA
jgi:hypothetical protein